MAIRPISLDDLRAALKAIPPGKPVDGWAPDPSDEALVKQIIKIKKPVFTDILGSYEIITDRLDIWRAVLNELGLAGYGGMSLLVATPAFLRADLIGTANGYNSTVNQLRRWMQEDGLS